MIKKISQFVITALFLLTFCACGEKKPAQQDQPKPANQQEKADKATPGLPPVVVAGLAKAKQSKQILIVHFHDDECNFCHEMDEVLALESVKKKLGEFIFINLEMRKDKGAMKYASDNDLAYSPTFLAYQPTGEQLEYSLEGFQPEDVFLVELENFKLIAAGKDDQAPPETTHKSYGKG